LSSYLQAIDNLTNNTANGASAGNNSNNSTDSSIKINNSTGKFKNKDTSREILKELLRLEEIVLHVLKLIENSCELCNEEFQNFFRF